MEPLELTFVIVKPEAFARGVEYDVLGYFAHRGLKTVALRQSRLTLQLAKELYKEHEGKPWYDAYINHMTSGPVFLVVFEAPQAVALVRNIIGATDPVKASPGTIRGDLVGVATRNLVHASDSIESAEREMALFFTEDDLFRYERPIDPWEWGNPTPSMWVQPNNLLTHRSY